MVTINNLLMLGFLKYGNLEHLQSLQDGTLYFNSLQYFAKYDETNQIGDMYENVIKQDFGSGATPNTQLGDFHTNHTLMIRRSDGSYQNIYSNTEFYANIFCLYSIHSEIKGYEYKFELPEEMNKEYSHILIINDTKEFVNRVKQKLQELKIQYQMNFVEYVDFTNFTGHKKYFQKPIKYSSQNEYRIMIRNTNSDPVKIDIGSIEDISVLHSRIEVKRVRIFIG